MARSIKEEIAWKPRRQRRLDMQARVAHLQKNLPTVVREVFAGDESRVDAVPDEAAKQPKKSKFAVLLWQLRSEGRNT